MAGTDSGGRVRPTTTNCASLRPTSPTRRTRVAGLGRATFAPVRVALATDRSDVVGLQDELPGTFELVSLETRRSDGAITRPFGDRPIGMFVFDRAGRFSVQLTDGDPTRNHGGYVAMFGSYVVDERQRTFTATPRGAIDANMVGTEVLRHVAFDDELAIFNTTPQHIDGLDVTTYITWRRVSQG